MDNRELLEAAAKAAGYADAKYKDMEGWGEIRYGLSEAIWSEQLFKEDGSGYWNPLVDDGEALRLAVKLGIEIGNYHQYERALAFIGSRRGSGEYWEVGADPAAATRRAIVRAAAAMSKED
jgi:hypothetical protein